METRAGCRDRCDICGSHEGVLVSALSECWLNPDSGYLIQLMTFRAIYLCVDCLEPDGGIVSTVIADGLAVVRMGSASNQPCRLVTIQTTPWCH
jgi:hypothetical protein